MCWHGPFRGGQITGATTQPRQLEQLVSDVYQCQRHGHSITPSRWHVFSDVHIHRYIDVQLTQTAVALFLCLLVALCSSNMQHVSVTDPRTKLDILPYWIALTDQTCCLTSHDILMLDLPVPALSFRGWPPGFVATLVWTLKSVIWLGWHMNAWPPALQTYIITTWPLMWSDCHSRTVAVLSNRQISDTLWYTFCHISLTHFWPG